MRVVHELTAPLREFGDVNLWNEEFDKTFECKISLLDTAHNTFNC